MIRAPVRRVEWQSAQALRQPADRAGKAFDSAQFHVVCWSVDLRPVGPGSGLFWGQIGASAVRGGPGLVPPPPRGPISRGGHGAWPSVPGEGGVRVSALEENT